MTEDSEPARLPTWRIVFVVALVVAVVGPLLYGIFYSYVTRTDAQSDVATAAANIYPYLVYVVPFVFLLGIWDLIRRYGHRKRS